MLATFLNFFIDRSDLSKSSEFLRNLVPNIFINFYWYRSHWSKSQVSIKLFCDNGDIAQQGTNRVKLIILFTVLFFYFEFSVSGLMIIARNYLDVYPYDKWNAKVSQLLYPSHQYTSVYWSWFTMAIYTEIYPVFCHFLYKFYLYYFYFF